VPNREGRIWNSPGCNLILQQIGKMKRRTKLPFRLRMIQGAMGKSYVIKHYKWGIIMTRYPDMTKIKASAKQRACRNLFQEAVVYAQTVIADPVLKAAWQKKLRRSNGVYNEAIKVYMLKEKLAKERADLLTKNLIRNSFKDHPSTYTPIGATRTVAQTIAPGMISADAQFTTTQQSQNSNRYASLFNIPRE
jgi:hypothetical protein